ncbi:MAG: hypothetical protein ACI4XW_06765 [Candidatus Spyradocola sp.]
MRTEPKERKNAGRVAAFLSAVCGLTALLFLFAREMVLQLASPVLAVIAIITGAWLLKRKRYRGYARTGILAGSVVLLLLAAGFLIMAIGGEKIVRWIEGARVWE